MVADQLRLGEVKRSKSCSSSLMTPSGDASARAVSLSTGNWLFAAAKHNGTAANANKICLNIVVCVKANFSCYYVSNASDRRVGRSRVKLDLNSFTGMLPPLSHLTHHSCRMLCSFVYSFPPHSFQSMLLSSILCNIMIISVSLIT